jgi:hypothetical protein
MPERGDRRPRPFVLPSTTPKCCNTDDRHPQAHDLRSVQAVSAPSKGKDQAIPTRPIHRKQEAAEKYEERTEISQHRVADATFISTGPTRVGNRRVGYQETDAADPTAGVQRPAET